MRQLHCGQERLRGGRSFILVVQVAKNMKTIAYEFYTKERGSIKFAVNRQEDGGEFESRGGGCGLLRILEGLCQRRLHEHEQVPRGPSGRVC